MFTLQTRDSETAARCGQLELSHGRVPTPIFMPVGTQATVKSVHPQELRDLGASIILGNTYHLNLRPGREIMRHFGGLHSFMNWDRPILTDSGGFQVFSLASLRKITEEGVNFRSHIDGSACFIGPETSMEIQADLGSDIAMLFDECPPHPCSEVDAETSLGLTLRWARRCRTWIDQHQPRSGAGRQYHFGIVQGSTYERLRQVSARELTAMEFDGYAIGGVSVGESEAEMLDAVRWSAPHLPENKPRYTMGVGTPPQLLEMIALGIDMFDCVLPTRVARNGAAYTTRGMINLRNKIYENDPRPIDPDGGTAPLVQGFSRGYLRHLVKTKEILGLRLITLHNLYFYLELMRQAREQISAGTFRPWKDEFIARYREKEITTAA